MCSEFPYEFIIQGYYMGYFGSDEFFNKLHKKVSSDNSKDADIYDELYEVIKKDVWRKIYSSLKNSEDTEDIFHEVYTAVYKKLVSFLLNSEYNISYQRQAWLNSITENKIKDFLNKKNETIEINKPNGEIEKKYIPYIVDSFDNEESNIKKSETKSVEEMYTEKYASEKLVNRLEHLLSLNVGIDRLLGYCYSKIIIPLNNANNFTKNASGKPKLAEKELNNRTIEDIVKHFPKDLQNAVEKKLPPYIFDKIYERLNEKKPKTDLLWKDIIFNLTPGAIADASNRIQTIVDKESERLDREEHKDEEKSVESDNKKKDVSLYKGGKENE